MNPTVTQGDAEAALVWISVMSVALVVLMFRVGKSCPAGTGYAVRDNMVFFLVLCLVAVVLILFVGGE